MDLTCFYSTVGALFLLLSVGFVSKKANLINDSGLSALSEVTLKVGQPFLILGAVLSIEYSPEKIKTGLLIVVVGVVVHSLMAIIAHFSVFKVKNINEKKILEFSMIFGNCGFVGFPIIKSFLGDEGLFYASFFVISFNLVVWTWGMVILGRNREDIKINVKTMFLNYGTVPCVISMLIYMLNIPIPDFITTSASYLGGLCTPISMLVTGALIASCSVKEFFLNYKVYIASFIKLLIIPAIVCLVAYACRLSPFFISFLTVMSAMPTATCTVMFAQLYDIERKEAAVITGLSALLFMGSLPLIVTLLTKIFF